MSAHSLSFSPRLKTDIFAVLLLAILVLAVLILWPAWTLWIAFQNARRTDSTVLSFLGWYTPGALAVAGIILFSAPGLIGAALSPWYYLAPYAMGILGTIGIILLLLDVQTDSTED